MIAAAKTSRIALGLAREGSEFEVQGSAFKVSGANPEPGTRNPEPINRYFIMMAGIGLDASIARSVNKKLKRKTGEFAYWLSGIKHLLLWRAEPFSLEVDGRRYQGAFAVIGNGKGYGGGMMMTPGARLEDPWFEVYILPPLANNFAYLRALRACMRGKPGVAGVSLVRGKHIKANSAHEPWVETDGEIIGPLPMTFDIVPDALSVIVP
jgi:diacylglycerol kinase family enzyme